MINVTVMIGGITHSCSTRSRLSRLSLKTGCKTWTSTETNTVTLQAKLSRISLPVKIPPAHHMTALGTLDPAVFGLMRTDVGLHSSRRLHRRLAGLSLICHEELVLCTAALAALAALTARPKKLDSSLAAFHWRSLKQGKQRLISHSLSVRGDRLDRDLRWGRSNPAEKRHEA